MGSKFFGGVSSMTLAPAHALPYRRALLSTSTLCKSGIGQHSELVRTGMGVLQGWSSLERYPRASSIGKEAGQDFDPCLASPHGYNVGPEKSIVMEL